MHAVTLPRPAAPPPRARSSYWATKGNELTMAPKECILSSAASMAVFFTEDTTPEVLKRASKHQPTTLIVVLTADGSAAQTISKYRPPCLTVVASTSQQVLRQAGVSFGQVPMMLESLDVESEVRLYA